MQTLKDKLAKGNVLGTFVGIGGIENAEILATAGFDWLIFDLEHSMICMKDLLSMIAVTENKGVASLVRVPQVDPGLCKRVLDAGCQGIMFPMIANAAEAKQAVQAVKYPPEGLRGVGLGRAQDYGANFNEYAASANDKTCVILQIETADGLNNLEEIVSVPGIDIIFIGQADLKKNLALENDNELEKHIQKIKKHCQEANLVAGIIEFEPDKTGKRFEEGFGFVAYSIDCLIYLNAAKQIVTKFRKA